MKYCFISAKLFQADFDEMSAEAKLCEDKAAKAMVDAARLADELRSEQDNAQMTEKQRRLLEAQKYKDDLTKVRRNTDKVHYR